MKNKKYIAYYRVSTTRQGESGLGLEAQQASVKNYLSRIGGDLIAEFTEIESTRRKQRPELENALNQCKREKTSLVIAKLDRLARNVAFISNLMESKVDFFAVDMPEASRLTIHILAAVAEHEREQISERTKSALKACKARGVKLGQTGKIRAKENKKKAQDFALTLNPVIEELRGEGIRTVREICNELNLRKIPTARGGRWHLPTVHNLLKRI